jgi:hypothetical protein
MKTDILYSIRTNQTARYWYIVYHMKSAKYKVVYGNCSYENSSEEYIHTTGNSVESEWTYVSGVNIGKSNETTDQEQLILTITRKETKKIETGFRRYHEAKEFHEYIHFNVMLANNFSFTKMIRYLEKTKSESKNESKNEYKIYFQPKLDGVRCYIRLDNLIAFSRNDKEFPLITEYVNNIFSRSSKRSSLRERLSSIILDGELYPQEESITSDLGSIISYIHSEPRYLSLHIFDLYDYNDPNMLYTQRLSLVNEIVSLLRHRFFKAVNTIPYTIPHTIPYNLSNNTPRLLSKFDKVIRRYHDYFTKPENGSYEGLIIRLDYIYETKRSLYLYKYKIMLDREFVVLDILEGVGNSSGVGASALVRVEFTEEDLENYPSLRNITEPPISGISITGTLLQKKRYLDDRNILIGSLATIRFQGYILDSGMLRFGELIAFRDYE